ncbi:DUF7948 domain-containing protein [Aurantibacillus circumpalustris]|uniref:DUF7948 domain-containing protein n=1 Tax=Aurantibacillus circumpalustris TaxID=3036359 RepID=UPI00295BA8F8|nr:SBBP repeat-containing protein [Aurantibacillus circumpalustris]
MTKFTSLFLSLLVFTFCVKAQNFPENTKLNKQFSFNENKGQISDQNFKQRPDILFSGTFGTLDFYLKADGISYQMNRIDSWVKEKTPLYRPMDKGKGDRTMPSQRSTYRIDINWLNSNSNHEILKGEPLAGFENYYGETCPNGAVNVKNYKSILYKNIYSGIDLKWYESNGILKYDYYVAANTNYKQIEFEYNGAEKISTNKNGELLIQTPLGIIIEQKPLVQQGNKELAASWVIKDKVVSFDIKNVDSSQPLVIDPMVRLWGTYYGGTNDDYPYGIKTDNLGNVYICGETRSTTNIATTGAHQTIYGGTGNYFGDAFLAKFDQNGVRQWATYYGGAQSDFANDCDIDANGNVYMVGGTSTSNTAVIATAGSHQSSAPGSTVSANVNDTYIVKFDSSGIRQWGTYYGGSGYEWAYFVNANASGDIIVSGNTNSTDGNSIATLGCHQAVYGGGTSDGFLVNFNTMGVRQWGTYYGGNANSPEDAGWCSFDSNGDIYLSGFTSSTVGISTPGSHQPALGGSLDAFLVKFNSAGVRQWGTYYGGSSNDYSGEGVIDASGNIYLTGDTRSTNAIATPGSHQFTFGGGISEDAFLIKFNSSGVAQWGTYYGGNGADWGRSASIDPYGNIYFSGFTGTSSGNAIVTACAYQSLYGGGSSDNFLAKFTPVGTRIWGTYFGGIYTDDNWGCAADLHGNVYLLGSTFASTGTLMATPGANQTIYGGMVDCFLEKFDGCIAGSAVNTTLPSNLLVCFGNSVTLSASCGNWYSSPTNTTILATGETFTTGLITTDTTFYVEDFGCGSVSGTRTAISVTVAPTLSINILNSNPTACVGESVTLTASGASTYSWTSSSTVGSTLQVLVFLNTTYTVDGTDANGCKATASIAIDPNLCIGISEQEKINISLHVFPNPNNGTFKIQSGYELNIQLTNQLGQTIRTLNLSSENNFQNSLSNLPNGIYFLKDGNNNTILNKKIIVIGPQ